jgi:hypothetical protein
VAMTGYRGAQNGSVQTNYTDQPGIGYPGQIAFSSDNNLVDAVLVGETNGVLCGAGIKLTVNQATEQGNLQRPDVLAFLPSGGEALADFGGFVVFDEGSQSDTDGNPGWAKGRNARILRPKRQGGRIYIRFADAAVAFTSTVNWVTVASADGKYPLGSISPAVLGGGAAGTSVAITTAQVVSSCAAGDVAIVELLG